MKTKMFFSNIAPSAALLTALATVLGVQAFTGLLAQPLHAQTAEWVKITTDRASTPAGREASVMVYDEKREVVVLHGGFTKYKVDGAMSDSWEWDGAIWTLVSTDGPTRIHFGMAYDPSREVIVLYGG